MWIISWLLLGLLLGAPPVGAQARDEDVEEYEYDERDEAAVSAPRRAPGEQRDSVSVIVPAETHVPVVLRNSVSTRTAYVGQNIYCRTTFPITVDHRIVIPAGTFVKGSVTQVVRAGRVKGKSKLGIRFESLVFPDGYTLSLRSALSAAGTRAGEGFEEGEGRIKGAGTKGKDAEVIVISGARSALIGAVVGRGKGAAIGGGVGAGAGVASVLLRRGKDIELRRGTDLELVLLQPIAVPIVRQGRRRNSF